MKYYGILMFLSLFTLISCNTPVIPSGPITDSNADTTPPHIADQVPIPGSSNVVARDPITLTFDEAIKPETINSQTLSLQVDGKAIATQVSFSQDGKTATITPENYADLGPENATLSVAIGEGITDLAGNKLERPTTDWKWEVPVWLEMGNFMTTPDADTAEIRLTLDKNDVPYLIWGKFVGHRGYECSGTSNNPTGYYASQPYLQKWESNRWHIIDLPRFQNRMDYLNLPIFDSANIPWLVAETDNTQVSSASLANAASGKFDILNTSSNLFTPKGYTSSVQLYINNQGQIYSTWYTGVGTFTAIRYWNGERWETIGDDSNMRIKRSASAYVHEAQLGFDSSGRLVAAWAEEQYDENGVRTVYLFVRRWDGTKWEILSDGFEGVNLYPKTHFVYNWVVTTDQTGNPLLVWKEIPISWEGVPGKTKIIVRRWLTSHWETLSEQESPSLKDLQSNLEGQLIVDSKGHLFYIWVTSWFTPNGPDYAKLEIRISRWKDNDWSSVSSINAGISKFTTSSDWRSNSPSLTSIDLDVNGNAYVTWMFGCRDQPQTAAVMRQNR